MKNVRMIVIVSRTGRRQYAFRSHGRKARQRYVLDPSLVPVIDPSPRIVVYFSRLDWIRAYFLSSVMENRYWSLFTGTPVLVPKTVPRSSACTREMRTRTRSRVRSDYLLPRDGDDPPWEYRARYRTTVASPHARARNGGAAAAPRRLRERLAPYLRAFQLLRSSRLGAGKKRSKSFTPLRRSQG